MSFQEKHKFTVPVELLVDPPDTADPYLYHAVKWIRETARKLQEQQALLQQSSAAQTVSVVQDISGSLSGGGSGGATDILVRVVIQAHPGGSALVTFSKKLPDVNYVPTATVYDANNHPIVAQISLITPFGFTVYCPVAGTLKATAMEVQ